MASNAAIPHRFALSTCFTPAPNRDIVTLLRRRESGVASVSGSTTTSQLQCWAELDCFIRNCNASYISMPMQPRSTIATAYSCDGSLLASTQYVPLYTHCIQTHTIAPHQRRSHRQGV